MVPRGAKQPGKRRLTCLLRRAAARGAMSDEGPALPGCQRVGRNQIASEKQPDACTGAATRTLPRSLLANALQLLHACVDRNFAGMLENEQDRERFIGLDGLGQTDRLDANEVTS